MPRLSKGALEALERGAAKRAALKRPAAILGIGTLVAGAAIGHTAHRMVSPGKEKDTPFMDAMFEAVTGDAQLDRDILGTDIGLSTILPLPRMPQTDIPGAPFHIRMPPNALRNFRMINKKTWGQIANDDTARRANSDYDAFTERQAEQWQKQQYAYGATGTGYDLNATGDMVFGMYNSRQGF